ncbi:MAG: hypothetical protein OXF54_12705 [Caldilineaceae bacterium]|nr:hypothetical protein [Caldilineaceae bacterium]
MLRLIDREFVRIRSYAFPSNSLPQLSQSLPQNLRREMTSLEVEGDDLVTIRYHLRSRVACIQTRDGVVSWQVGEPCKLQISYRKGSRQSHRETEPAEQAARIPTWDSLSPEKGGPAESTGSLIGEDHEELSLGQSIIAPPVLEEEHDSSPGVHNGDLAHLHIRNGRNGSFAAFNRHETDGNGAGDQIRRGYVRLELLEGESQTAHTILSSDTYSLASLGRFCLLAETLAGWMKATTGVVSS